MSYQKFIIIFAACVLSLFYGVQEKSALALNNTYTICDSLCDFTSLTDAIAVDLTGDTVQIVNPFTFDDSVEDDNLFLPQDVILECENGVQFGDAAQDLKIIWPGSNNIIRNCTFENINIDTTFGNNVYIEDNIFSNLAQTSITLTGTDGFEITGNTALQHLQIQAPRNGLIDNNTFECRYDTNCIGLFNDTPENIVISNNSFVNYNLNHGTIVDIQRGSNIDFVYNTVSSVTMNDVLVRMLTVRIEDAYIAYNYFFMPERTVNPNGSAWAIEAFLEGDPISMNIEHNTIVQNYPNSSNSNDAALGLSDNGSFSNVPVDLTYQYNLYYQAFSVNPQARGIDLEYVIGSADLTLNEDYNGFYGVAEPIYDSTGTITSLGSNTIFSDPLFRTENLDNSDDFYSSPISRYFDVDGVIDIGAYSDARVSTYTIDDDCIVDYVDCFSNQSSVLRHAVSTGDYVTILDGNYDGVILDFPVDDVLIEGQGSNTIFDANGNGDGDGLMLSGFTNSEINNFQVQNSFSTATITYDISNIIYDFGGDTYNQTAALGFGIDDITLLFVDNICTVFPIIADGTDITSIVGSADENWNLVLMEVFGLKITALVPDDLASDETEFINYASTACGVAPIVDVFISGIFTVSNEIYTYDGAAALAAAITISSGFTDPPLLQRYVSIIEAGGVRLENSDNNTFNNIDFDSNSIGLFLDADSSDNTFVESLFQNSTLDDVYSLATDVNSFVDTFFDIGKVSLEDTGNLDIYYSVRANVKNAQTLNSLNGSTVSIKDAQGNLIVDLTTDAFGNTPFTSPILATILEKDNPFVTNSGGLNPFSITTSAVGFIDKIENVIIQTPKQLISLSLSPVASQSGGGGGGGGGGGAGIQIFENLGINSGSNEENSESSDLVSQKNCQRIHGVRVFVDTEDHWADSFIQNLYENCVVDGRRTGEFEPDEHITRAEATKIAVRLFSFKESEYIASFIDVTPDDWFEPFITSAYAKGVVSGYLDENMPDGRVFKPNQNVTRAEALKILLVGKNLDIGMESTEYDDVSSDDWYYHILAYATNRGVVEGYELEDGSYIFAANQFVTRAEYAKMAVLINALD